MRRATRPAPPPSTDRSFGPVEVGQLLLLSLMWGLSFTFVEYALQGLTPLWIVAGRTVVGGSLLLIILMVRGRRLPRDRQLWGRLLLIGFMNNAGPWTMLAWAQQAIPSGLAGLLMALVPTTTLLVAAVVGLERITPRRLIGLLLALAGVAAIVAGDVGQPGQLLAVAAVALATFLYASSAVYAKTRLSGSDAPLVLATGQVLGAASMTVPFALLVDGPPQLVGLALAPIVAVVLLGVLGTGMGYLVFYDLVAKVGATNATLTTYLIPVVAVVAGWLVLDEQLAVTALLGGGLILLGIWLAQRTPAPPTAVTTSR